MICIVARSSTGRAVPTRLSGDGGHGAQERAFAHPTVLFERNALIFHWRRIAIGMSRNHGRKDHRYSRAYSDTRDDQAVAARGAADCAEALTNGRSVRNA